LAAYGVTANAYQDAHPFHVRHAARKHLEAIQWPDGTICHHCGVIDRASSIKGGRKDLWFCNSCRMQFSVTVGTVFERSKVPLHTWLYANHLLVSSKKGISSQQLSRMLAVTVKTAWFMGATGSRKLGCQ
jgi:transposase-like protein